MLSWRPASGLGRCYRLIALGLQVKVTRSKQGHKNTYRHFIGVKLILKQLKICLLIGALFHKSLSSPEDEIRHLTCQPTATNVHLEKSRGQKTMNIVLFFRRQFEKPLNLILNFSLCRKINRVTSGTKDDSVPLTGQYNVRGLKPGHLHTLLMSLVTPGIQLPRHVLFE